MWSFCIAISGVLAALAWQLARERPAHRAVAIFVALNLAADVLGRVLAVRLVRPAYALGGPLTGIARAAFHATQSTFLAWPFGLVALAALVLQEGPTRRRMAIAAGGAYIALLIILAAAYPAIRGPRLASLYQGVHVAAVVAILGAWASWWHRQQPPSLTTGSVLILTVMEIGVTTHWQPFKSWDFQAGLHMLAYGALIAWHGGELWCLRSRRSA